jgi:hypothetical protein
MSMSITSTAVSPVAVEICQGNDKVQLLALNAENCDGVVSGATLNVVPIAILKKSSKTYSIVIFFIEENFFDPTNFEIPEE